MQCDEEDNLSCPLLLGSPGNDCLISETDNECVECTSDEACTESGKPIC